MAGAPEVSERTDDWLRTGQFSRDPDPGEGSLVYPQEGLITVEVIVTAEMLVGCNYDFRLLRPAAVPPGGTH